jgi:hypothetical protein
VVVCITTSNANAIVGQQEEVLLDTIAVIASTLVLLGCIIILGFLLIRRKNYIASKTEYMELTKLHSDENPIHFISTLTVEDGKKIGQGAFKTN